MASGVDSFKAYGDISVDYINLNLDDVSYSLMDVYVELNIYESVFSSVLTGSITILDSNNIIKNLNIVGGEEQIVSFKFKTKGAGQYVSNEMCVYKIGDRVKFNENSYIYKIFLISKEAFENNKTLISRSFKGIYSDHVADIFSGLNSDKKIDIAQTSYPVSWISMYWKPFEAIDFICAKALSKSNKNPSFVFYEDLDGYVFKSLEDVFTSEPVAEYTKLILDSFDYTTDLNGVFFSPREIKTNYSSNILNSINEGVYGSTVVTYDVTRKTIEKLNTQWSDFQHIDNPLTENSYVGSVINTVLKHDKRTNLSGDNIKREHLRSMFLGSLNVSNITASVSLNSGLRVGNLLKLNVGSPEHRDVQAKNDNHLFGNHLILNLSHSIKPDSGETTIELVKDSVYLNDNS